MKKEQSVKYNLSPVSSSYYFGMHPKLYQFTIRNGDRMLISQTLQIQPLSENFDS
jgi:hypothetical protein